MAYATAGKILIVDDESQNVEMFRRLMGRLSDSTTSGHSHDHFDGE